MTCNGIGNPDVPRISITKKPEHDMLAPEMVEMIGAPNEDRTRKIVTYRQILSLLRLPISPSVLDG